MHFVIITESYLALIRLLFVELGFFQIKRKYYTTIPIYSESHALIDWYVSVNLVWKEDFTTGRSTLYVASIPGH